MTDGAAPTVSLDPDQLDVVVLLNRTLYGGEFYL